MTMSDDDGSRSLSPEEFAKRVAAQLEKGTGPRLRVVKPDEFFEAHDEADAAQNDAEVESRIPPHDLDAEGAVLSAVMIDREAIAKIKFLKAEHFYSEAHRRIFEACVEVVQTGSIDIIQVATWMRDHNRLAQAGGFAYLTEVLNCAPTVTNVAQYAKAVHDKWRARTLIQACQRVQAFGYAGLMDFKALAETLRVEIEHTTVPIERRIRPNSHNLFDRWITEGPLVHESIGLGPLDDLTGGGPVYGSRWYVLGAPDACKTAFIIQVADTFARRGLVVGVLAVDEEDSDMQTRLIQRAGFSRQDAEKRELMKIDKMRAAIQTAHPIPISYFSDEDTIESAAEELAKLGEMTGKRVVLLIDSLQTVTCNSILELDEEPTEYVKVTRNVRAIRAVASKHQLIAITTSEMNREAYKAVQTGDKRAHMGSGKQSGAIEYSARVMIAWEPTLDKKNKNRPIPDHFCVSIEKNKHGPRGDFFHVILNRKRMQISVAPPPTDPEDDAAQETQERVKKLTAKQLERKHAKDEADRQHAEARRQAEETRDRRDDDACLEAIRNEPGLGTHALRAEMSARLGGCDRKRQENAVARLRLRRLIRVESAGFRRPARYFLIGAGQDAPVGAVGENSSPVGDDFEPVGGNSDDENDE